MQEMMSRLQGQVLLPGQEGYDAERARWNQIVEHHPEVIVVAASPDDVAAAVRYAASADLPVAVQATGHGPSVPADGAVLINTRRMTELEVDPVAGTARIGAGVKGGTVLREAAPHGLAPLIGSTPDVGMVGYLTSGGLPMLGRRYGFAADHVRALELITADGRSRRATAEEHPELFWAVRGKFLVHVRVAYTGWPAEGERLIRPLRAMGPVMDTVADIPHTKIGDVHSDPAGPAPVRDRGILLRELDNEAVERLAELAGPGAELPPGQVEIRHLGGALGRVPESPNAISYRDAAFGMNVVMIAPPGREEQVDRIQLALIGGLRPWDTGATLPNYLGSGNTRPSQVRAAYRDADYERLAAIKATHDPRNLFRVNHNIPPRPNSRHGHS